MKYTDPIAKSLTDTEYAGGIIFKQLVEEGTIVPFDGDVKKQNAILFTLDKYCYLGKTTATIETRAYLLVDQMTTMYNAKVRLILCDGLDRKAGKMKLLEVLPAPDPEYPIYGDDWMHKLKWFLKAEGIGINVYESVARRCQSDAYLTAHFDLRGQEITTLEHRLNFLTEFAEFVSYFTLQARRGRSQYGCMQRSRNYSEILERHDARVSGSLSPKSRHWGLMLESDVRFNAVSTYPGMVVNSADDVIVQNDTSSFGFLAEHMFKIAKVHDIELRVEPPEKWTVETFTSFRDYFLKRTEKLYSAGLDFNDLPTFNL